MLGRMTWRKLAFGLVFGLTAIGLGATTALVATPSLPASGAFKTPTMTVAITVARPTPTAMAGTGAPSATAAADITRPAPTGTAPIATSTTVVAPASATPPRTPSLAQDARYFFQTGFRIDNDTIWDYFNRRGDVVTFGYPVSRTFTLQGFTVQFFQRRVVQLDESGQARLLDILNPGIMPYSTFNGATLPGIDPVLLRSVPPSTNVSGLTAFVKAHAPDSFRGMPVNFYQTFLNTVPTSVASSNGGDASLLPEFDLEMWGVPTSAVLIDPTDHNSVYLRFQRGIMRFDAQCSCTQGLLLGDNFKRILTGQNLSPDLDPGTRASVFYKQYDPSRPGWVRDARLLRSTDLTNAFAPE